MTNTSIVVCGEKFDIGARVVLWNETGGFNGYDTSTIVVKEQNRKTGKIITKTVSGKRYSSRSLLNLDLDKLKKIVTQFFLHHSGLYRSSATFKVLHNDRKLSVHFILDDDGIIYQTLDLKEKAWHGGNNNPISVGIEIDSRANADELPDAYDEAHQLKYKVGPRQKRLDKVNGASITGYEYNEKQYESLIKLGIALKNIFPLMSVGGKCDFPRNKNGEVIKSVLPKPLSHCGLICHYNNNSGKIDPICFDHERFFQAINGKVHVIHGTSSWADRQRFLRGLGYDPGQVDGVFGPKTKKALQQFQTNYGLTPNGEWGEKEDYLMDLTLNGE